MVNLGGGCYLEILAIDETNKDIKGPRWMGIDYLTTPKITRWSLKSDDLDHDSNVLFKHNDLMGVVDKGTRKTTDGNILSWQMTLPLSAPEVEVVPFITDWSTSNMHPTDNLPEQCQLVGLDLYHTQPNVVEKLSLIHI